MKKDKSASQSNRNKTTVNARSKIKSLIEKDK